MATIHWMSAVSSPPPLQVLLQGACHVALSGTPPDNGPLVAKSYEVLKLSAFAANPAKMRMDIGFVEPLVKLMGQQEMVNTIAHADVDASYALEWPCDTSLYLGDVEAVFKHKEQAMSFLVEVIGEELACSTMEWLQVSVKSVESKIEAFVVDSQSELESAAGALMASLATFAVDAPRSDANALKALGDNAKDALAKAKRSAAKLNNYWPADLEEYKKLEVAHEDTKLFIIAWGASDLLRRPGVSHVTKGKQVRDALKTIYEGRIKDSENKFLDDDFKARVEKLLSIDCVPVDVVASSSEPPAKRRKMAAKTA